MATLLAVFHRDRTGHGQRVTSSLLGGGVLTNGETYLGPDGVLAPVATVDRDQTGTSPGHRLYRVADGWVALCARDDDEVAASGAALGQRGPEALVGSHGFRHFG